MKNILFIFFAICSSGFSSLAEDSLFIKVHFLYGSKPGKEFKASESNWFGGKLGGHVGIEIDSDRILNFVPSGKFHKFSKADDRHSKFVFHTSSQFYSIFGGKPREVKQAVFIIPITSVQKRKLDSIAKVYTGNTPYDYAFFGMRCGAAAYDILGQLQIVESYSHRKTYLKIFYPKKLRKRLFELAALNRWKTEMAQGSDHRIWEKD